MFYLFILLETKFAKCKGLTWKMMGFTNMFSVFTSLSSTINQFDDFALLHVCNAFDIRTATGLNTYREPVRCVIIKCFCFSYAKT